MNLIDSLKTVMQTKKSYVLILSIIYMLLVIIPHFFDFISELKYINKRYYLAKHLIFLMPTSTLMIEETFIKMLKAITKKHNIK